MGLDKINTDRVDLHQPRLARPVPDRIEANRSFKGVWQQNRSESAYKIDDELMSKGRDKAKEKSRTKPKSDVGSKQQETAENKSRKTSKRKARKPSPEAVAAAAVENGYDMIDEFLQQPDAFGIPDTGEGNLLEGDLEKLLAGLAGAGGITSNIAGIYSQYLQIWNGLFGQFAERVAEGSLSGFEEFAGFTAAGGSNSAGTVVMTNRELEVDIHWKAGMPTEAISVATLHALSEAAEPPAKVSIKIRQSVDAAHQVFDVRVPNAIKTGRYYGILVDAEGIDQGYMTIAIPELGQ